jgi:hypothetical protein
MALRVTAKRTMKGVVVMTILFSFGFLERRRDQR